MKDRNRSIIVVITNIYMLINSIVVCVDFYINERYIGLQSANIFMYITLILMVLFSVAILILSWE